MFGIASIFRVSLADLLAVNPGLSEGSYLQAGQRVRIPPFTTACGNGEQAGQGAVGCAGMETGPPTFCRCPYAWSSCFPASC